MFTVFMGISFHGRNFGFCQMHNFTLIVNYGYCENAITNVYVNGFALMTNFKDAQKLVPIEKW